MLGTMQLQEKFCQLCISGILVIEATFTPPCACELMWWYVCTIVQRRHATLMYGALMGFWQPM